MPVFSIFFLADIPAFLLLQIPFHRQQQPIYCIPGKTYNTNPLQTMPGTPKNSTLLKNLDKKGGMLSRKKKHTAICYQHPITINGEFL